MKKGILRLAAGAASLVFFLGAGVGTGGEGKSMADESLKINYSGFLYGTGWSQVTDDNQLCMAPEGSYLTAIKANLLNQPEGVTGTVEYEVNLSGSGWLAPTENGVQAGAAEGQMPLEAVRMRLSGQLQESYDIYYSVFQNGTWTPWALNGDVAGTEGAGMRIDGIKVSVTAKGAGEPAPQPEPPKKEAVKSDAAVEGRIDPSKPMVALTFDDGPNASVTNRILDSLEASGGRATFFIVGNRVKGKENIASVKRMAKLGCEVGNHAYEHKQLTKLGRDGKKNQLSKANQSIKDACGVSPVLMRPPGGAKDKETLAVAKELGMSAVLWNIDTLDWKTKDKQKAIDAVLNHVKDGDIVLMHDLYSTTADAAEVIIPELRARGYQLVTVSELASYRGGTKAGEVYGSFHKK